MGQIFRFQGLTIMTLGLAFVAGCDGGGGDSAQACMSIGGGGTQFSSTGGVTDGPATIDREESTYGTLTILSAGSGTMRATAQSGVVFPAGSGAGILQSISYSGDVEMSLRTYESNVLQEEFAFVPGHQAPAVVSFKTTRQYDAIEFSATQLSADTDTPGSCYSTPPICNSPHEVTARIHEFCSN